MRVRIPEIETSCEESSRYLEELRETQGKKSAFLKDLHFLTELLRWRGLSQASIQVFLANAGSGLVYVEFPDTELEIHLRALRDLLDNLKNGSGWEDRDYEFFLSDDYRNVFNNAPQAIILFELGHRMLFSRVLQEAGIEERSLRNQISRTAAARLASLLKRVRKEFTALTGEMPLADLLDSCPFVGIPLSKIVLEDLQPELMERGLTPSVLRGIHRALCSKKAESVGSELRGVMERVTLRRVADLKDLPLDVVYQLSDRELGVVLKAVAEKAKEEERSLSKEQRELDLKVERAWKESRNAMDKQLASLQSLFIKSLEEDPERLVARVSDLVGDLYGSFAGYLHNLKKCLKKREDLDGMIERTRALGNLSLTTLKGFLKESSPSEAERLLKQLRWFGIEEESLSGSLQNTLTTILAQEERELLKQVREGGRDVEERLEKMKELKERKRYSPAKALDAFLSFMKEVIEPLVISKTLESLVFIWPPATEDTAKARLNLRDNANFTGIELIPKGKLYRFSVKGRVTPKPSRREERERLSEILERRLGETVSVLAYEIRGADLVGARLHNSDQVGGMVSELTRLLAKIGRKKEGFLLRSSGDGGMIWFGANAREIYASTYREWTSSRGIVSRQPIGCDGEIELKAAADSGTRAVLSACSMVRAAEEFARYKYSLYKDLLSDNDLYEPPFQIAVGITSGEPGTDLSLGPNGFGDLDAVGVAVSQARRLSSLGKPSVVLIDGETFYNLLLNVGRFESKREVAESNARKESMISRVAQIVRLREKRRVYSIENPACYCSWVGYLLVEEVERGKALIFDTREDAMELDENFELTRDGKKIKLIYEVSPEMAVD